MYNDRRRGGWYAEGLLGATERAITRAAAIVHEDLKCGLNTLATIVCTAPLVGVLGTIRALSFDTFLGVSGERSSDMAALAERISWACVPTALGILVGLQALWIYRYLRGRLEECDLEMQTIAIDLIQLVPRAAHLRLGGTIRESGDSVPCLEAYSTDSEAHRGYRRFGALVTTLLLLAGFGVQMAIRLRSVEFDALPLGDLIVRSLCSLMMVFCFVCLPVYAVWVDLLHRRPGGVVAPVGAALSLAWCVAGLMRPAVWF